LKDEVVLTNLKKEYDLYEKNKLISAKYELEIDQNKLELDGRKKKIEYYESNKVKHERNIEIDKQLVILRTKIETANSEIKQSNIQIERFKNEISNLKDKIKINSDLITKIKNEETVQLTYKTYLSIFGKNGISKTILRDMIPLLNNELSMLLDDSCYFKLEVNINERNELEFVMIDSDTRVVKPLNAGSGYERTIASLALRSVLTKVSALPKPNIVVMDEVFGKIADENLEMVGEFFKKIKEYFENIFVISHNPLIRTWSDNLLMVKKDENVSIIESVNTKIS
jgi:DNA repair exonuclease SbcCD ATPase subunit